MAFALGLIEIIKAIPAIKSLFEQLVGLYVASELVSMKKENRDAIKKAIHEFDQREIEKALGNPNAGDPSNLPGSELRSSLPGVPNKG